jgi:alpha-beta hydrolase superfamily lysophospholipase
MNWVEVNGTSMRYELTGSGPATLVLVHEMGGTLESWDRVLPALNNGRGVLRYDTRGAGLSEKLKGTVTWNQMADDLAGLLDAPVSPAKSPSPGSPWVPPSRSISRSAAPTEPPPWYCTAPRSAWVRTARRRP